MTCIIKYILKMPASYKMRAKGFNHRRIQFIIQTNNQYFKILMWTYIFFLSTLILAHSSISQSNRKQYPINIQQSFSSDSDVSVIITSCNRIKQLTITLNSFFHYNTYPINKLLILEDCNPQNVNDIWKILPPHARKYPNHFVVMANEQRKGQIGALDVAYSKVSTKYLYHLEDDWVQLRGYGMLERMRDVAIDAEKKSRKVSQIVQNFLAWNWNHQLSKAYWTQHKVKYHEITSYGKDWLYHFSFNPHFVNMDIYRKQLNSSFIQSIAKKYHCLNKDGSQFMEDGGCVEKYLGQHLTKAGYKQVFINVGEEPFYFHTGFKEFNEEPIQLKLLDDSEVTDSSQINRIPVIDPLPEEGNSKNHGLSNDYGKVLLVTMILFLIFGLFKACELVFKKKKLSLSDMAGDQSPETQSVIRNAQN